MSKNKKHQKKQLILKNISKRLTAEFISKYDPLGSYTGRPCNKEPPVQDADDL